MDNEERRDAFARRFNAALATSGKAALSDGELLKLLARNGVVVTTQTVSNWRNGKHMPKLDQIEGLAQTLGTDPAELAFGRAEASASAHAARYVGSDDERAVVEGYALLDEERRAAVRELVRLLAQPGRNGMRPGRRKSV